MIEVEQRQLGASGIAVPSLGVGVWSWGEKGFWGYGKDYTLTDVEQAYQACLDAGLNFFDTAEIYGRGESERILGACMRKFGRPTIVASKFAPLPVRLSAHALLDALEHSLERLGVDSIDLYQIHWPYTFINQHALMDALAEAVRAGKVRAVGVSNYSATSMRKAYDRLARHDIPLASNQVHYNLLHRNPETNGVLNACRELNIAMIAYSPLEQGLLTGKFRAGNTQKIKPPFPRNLQKGFRSAQQSKMDPLFLLLDEVAHVHEKTIGQVALNWLLGKDEHIIPIPGAKTLRQARENAGAIGWHLSEDEHFRISQAAQQWVP